LRESCTSGSEGRAEVAAHHRRLPRPDTSWDRGNGWEGPNAKPSVRTVVLVIVALTAANPVGGLAGRV
jgi:hypothetical protein